jgi:hypothetical protein
MPKIIIIGAGISGLSCAFDLLKNGKNYQIEIYEATDTFGGQAKSVKTDKCYVPYAWRIWTNFYYNFLDITHRIPLPGGGAVSDNLVEIPKYSHEIKNVSGRQVAGGGPLDRSKFPSDKSYNTLIYKLLHAFLMSDERLKENDITFYDYINPQDKATRDFCDEFTGPIIGMEARKVTLYCIIRGWAITYGNKSILNGFSGCTIYVTNGPYSEVLFNPWVDFLRGEGVKVHTNTPIKSINYDPSLKRITNLVTQNGDHVVGDDYVMCLDQTAASKLINTNKNLLSIEMFRKAASLHIYGNEMYFGMVLYFSEKFMPEIGTGCATEQPWAVVIENFSASWKDKYKLNCSPAREIVQASCLDLVPGLKGKTLRECSLEEAVDETIEQLKRSNLFKTLKTETGKSAFDTFLGYDIWPDWGNNEEGKIYNKRGQYKLSINPYCWDYMPSTQTPVDNFFFGSVMTKTDTPMVSMEMACTNGRYAARAILNKNKSQKEPYIHPHKGLLPVLLAPVKATDAVFYKAGLKINLVPILVLWIVLITILIMYVIVALIKGVSHLKNPHKVS